MASASPKRADATPSVHVLDLLHIDIVGTLILSYTTRLPLRYLLEWLLRDQYLRAFGKKLSRTMDFETSARVYQDLHQRGVTALREWDQRCKRVAFLDDVRDKLNDLVYPPSLPSEAKPETKAAFGRAQRLFANSCLDAHPLIRGPSARCLVDIARACNVDLSSGSGYKSSDKVAAKRMWLKSKLEYLVLSPPTPISCGGAASLAAASKEVQQVAASLAGGVRKRHVESLDPGQIERLFQAVSNASLDVSTHRSLLDFDARYRRAAASPPDRGSHLDRLLRDWTLRQDPPPPSRTPPSTAALRERFSDKGVALPEALDSESYDDFYGTATPIVNTFSEPIRTLGVLARPPTVPN